MTVLCMEDIPALDAITEVKRVLVEDDGEFTLFARQGDIAEALEWAKAELSLTDIKSRSAGDTDGR